MYGNLFPPYYSPVMHFLYFSVINLRYYKVSLELNLNLKVYYYALCFPLQPKSTSTALIGKTASSAEEQESLSNTATKDEDTEGEWMEQKIDFRKLPRQYMQLSKIRLTGT